jgi:UDP-glucose 4-epimerase
MHISKTEFLSTATETKQGGFIHINKVVNTLLQAASLDIPSGVYNLSDKNIEILDLVDVLKEIYPSLEFIFINQHLSLRDLRVSSDTKLNQYFKLPETSLKDELLEFKSKFAFSTMF